MDTNTTVVPAALIQAMSEGTPRSVVERYASLPERAAASDFGRFDEDIVVLDTETTGLSFHHDELTQIAAARMRKGEIIDWFVTFVNPGKEISDDIVHLTGITDEDVADAPTPEEALDALVDFVGDAVVVAHNAEFDRTFVTRHPAGYPLLENLFVDSLELARIAVPRLKSHRLLDLVRAFDAPLSTHRADADVEATCAIFRILLAAIDALPHNLVTRIAELAPRDDWPTGEVFAYFAGLETHADGTPFSQDETAEFSLRKLRQSRLGTERSQAREDARDIILMSEEGLQFPTEDEIAAAFSVDGLVGCMYPDYEVRVEQQSMAQAVRAAFASSDNLVVEAGTGVGKSMAYLVPAALTARMNNITVGVATKTNALLDQLVYRELPMLAEALPGLTYAPLKGFAHYPCLLRIDRTQSQGARMKEIQGKMVCQAPSIAAVLSFVEQTDFSDIDSLKIDYRAVPRSSITTPSRECLGFKCPFRQMCYVHGVRAKAEGVDIVVTNHSLLFSDLVSEGALLPPIRFWIVDEAHGAEAEARDAFSVSLGAEDLLRLARQMESDDSSRNPLLRAERRAAALGAGSGAVVGENTELLQRLASKARVEGAVFADAARELATRMRDLLYFDKQGGKSKGYDLVDLWLNEDIRRSSVFAGVRSSARDFDNAAETLVRGCLELVASLENYPELVQIEREVALIAMTVKGMLNSTDVLFGPTLEKYAYAATLSKKDDRPGDAMQALIYNVGSELEETLFARAFSVVFTSATLTVGDSFEAFNKALNLNAGEESHARTLALESCYDYDNQMIVYVPNDLPDPTEPGYLEALQELLTQVHLASRGSCLTLFTNRREMEDCFNAVKPRLKEEDLRLVCQKWGVSTKTLRDDFLADEHLSLFALKSFWEGFDAPGATLKGVIIPKIPFARPTDPLSCERSRRDEGAWRHYTLPQAVIEIKQAAGRLIRKADDSGFLLMADARLLSKTYGRTILNSLPSHTIRVASCDDIVKSIRAAYGADR